VLLFSTQGLNGIPQTDLNASDALVGAVKDAIRSFYGMRHECVYVMQDSGISDSITTHIVDRVLHQNEELTVTFKLQNEKSFVIPGPKKVNNLIFVESYESFTRIYQKMDPDLFEFQGFYLIILTHPLADHYFITRKILEDFWRNYIINVNVIVLNPTLLDEAFIYTYFPYSKDICGTVRPSILSRFNTTLKVNQKINYFPKKVSDLKKCSLTCAIFETKPFMLIKKNVNGQIEIDGIDAKLLLYISNKLNFNPILKVSDIPWGLALDNGTMTDTIKMVYNLEANLTLGYFFKTEDRDRVMTASWSYHTSKSYWIVPPGQPYSSFEKLFKPFKQRLWMAVTLTFITSNLIIFIFNWNLTALWNLIFEKSDCPYYNNFIIVFGGVMPAEPLKNCARIIFAFYLLYWLVVRSAYQGALFQFLQQDFNKPHLKNSKEMIEHNFNFYVDKTALELFEDNLEILKRSVLLN
jgi:hypothetical protein